MASTGIIRTTEKALGLALGLAWIGWHVARFGMREAREAVAGEAQHTCSALRGALDRLRGDL